MIRLAIRVPRESAEVVLAELLELVPGGVEERDCGEGIIEYAVYGAEGEIPTLPALQAAAAGASIEVSSSRVADGWEEAWKEFHRPVRVEAAGRGLTVAPPWEAGEADDEVVIDPGRAFGTGAHPTTRMCLELLLSIPAGGSCLDVGSGSGVLSIAAARLGWDPVLALDHDAAAVEATLSNALANGATVAAQRFDLLRDGAPPGARLVMANLLRPLLAALAGVGFEGPGPEWLVASGLLADEADEASALLGRAFGMSEAARLQGGDWAAVLLERAPGA